MRRKTINLLFFFLSVDKKFLGPSEPPLPLPSFLKDCVPVDRKSEYDRLIGNLKAVQQDIETFNNPNVSYRQFLFIYSKFANKKKTSKLEKKRKIRNFYLFWCFCLFCELKKVSTFELHGVLRGFILELKFLDLDFIS